MASRASGHEAQVAARPSTRSYWPGRVAKHAVLLLFGVIALVPIYFMLVNSFKTADEYISNPYGIPSDVTLSTLARGLARGRSRPLAAELVHLHLGLGRPLDRHRRTRRLPDRADALAAGPLAAAAFSSLSWSCRRSS